MKQFIAVRSHEMLFQRIRSDCCAVAEHARWVRIDYEALHNYPHILKPQFDREMSHSKDNHLLDQGDDTLRFFLILDCINFGSGYFPYLQKGSAPSGYFMIAKQLTDYVKTYGIPSPAELMKIDLDACCSIFKQDRENPHALELMHLFALALVQLGKWTIERYDGDYLGFLKEADSAESVVEALGEMPFFGDVSHYFGRPIHFYKRAQIYVQDAAIAEPGHKLLQFPDIHSLTVFADNVLPYVLHADGILRYEPWLASRIEREELIGQGSPEEIELRACAIHAAEEICRIVNAKFAPMHARELDYVLWSRGQLLKKSVNLKRHRTRCVFY